jgi:hypothetical protein
MLAALHEPDARRMAVSAREPVYFQAPDYTHWTVHEVHDPAMPSARSLIFVSSSGFRRVRTYPDTWRQLSADALWELSWQR